MRAVSATILISATLAFPLLPYAAESSGGRNPFGPRLRAATSNFVEVDASRHALIPNLVGTKDRLLLTWLEVNPKGVPNIHVRRWDGTNWQVEGGLVNQDKLSAAYDPSLAILADDTPFIAWAENTKTQVPQIYLKHLDAGSWVQDGSSLNLDPARPAVRPILAANTTVFLGWTEASERRVFLARVRRLDPDGWTLLGDALNVAPDRDAIDLSMDLLNGQPFVAWCEASADKVLQIRAKMWDGTQWITAAESLNLDSRQHAFSPIVRAGEDSVYVSWIEIGASGKPELNVNVFSSGKWQSLATNLHAEDASYSLTPSLAYLGGNLYVAWAETDPKGTSRIHSAKWNGSDWQVSPRLNLDTAKPGATPTIAIWNGKPVVVWKELEEGGLFSLAVAGQ